MSKNQRAVHIYSFKGSGGPPEDRPAESLNFKDFFELKHETVVLKESEMLSKDFCLVTANGRFIIDKREFKNEYITIAHHTGVSLYDSLFAVMLIQSQAIQIIHIKNNGKLIDLHRIGWFNHDDDELVLARYRDFNEQFIAQQTIKSTSPFYHHGYSLKDEESGDPRAKDRFESFALAPTMSSMAEFSADATYHQVPSSSSSSIGIPSRINQANYSYISQMAYNQSYYDEQADSTYQTAFFVFYDIRTTEILAVYDNASEEFLRLYEAWADQFCATAYTTAGRGKRHYSSTCSNNIYAKDHLKKTQTAQAVKRSLCVLPYSPQSLSDSPYLDQALFSYDEKVISASDRQRPCQDFPIKFYLRGSGELRFKIHLFKPGMISSTSTSSSSNGGVSNSSNNNTAGVSNNTINALNGNIINTGGTNTIGTNNNAAAATTGTGSGGMMRSKRFATFIAHPFEPFIISIIQYHLQPTVLNLHLYRPDAEPL
ncbi:acid phosphatase det1 [Gamsiella multidivaricata]|nr:acid phosphatase det1 [Gamsiella multidivaricata]